MFDRVLDVVDALFGEAGLGPGKPLRSFCSRECCRQDRITKAPVVLVVDVDYASFLAEEFGQLLVLTARQWMIPDYLEADIQDIIQDEAGARPVEVRIALQQYFLDLFKLWVYVITI